jgi:hypothetical protein
MHSARIHILAYIVSLLFVQCNSITFKLLKDYYVNIDPGKG